MGFLTATDGKLLPNLWDFLNKFSFFYNPDGFTLIWLTVAIISGLKKWCK
jgi:hypothetical protein